MITARSNNQLKQIAKLLKKRSAREEERTYVIEGKKMFFEAVKQVPDSLIKAYWSQSGLSGLSEEERALMKACPYEEVTDDAFGAVSETVTPQGVIALMRMPEHSADGIVSSGKGILLLETLQDPGNLGTILRTAEAAGIGGIFLSADSVDAFSPKVVRATMGAIWRVPFVYAEQFTETLKMLKNRNVTLCAAHLAGSVPYDKADYKGQCGILIGNEGNGLSDEVTALCDVRIRIPMEGQAESLNAGVAAALLMYELKRHG